MLAVQGYYDGVTIKPLEAVIAKPNQRVIITIMDEFVAEVVYVLKGVYSMERDKIASTIKGFLELVHCQTADILNVALDAYAKRNVDFVDSVLYA